MNSNKIQDIKNKSIRNISTDKRGGGNDVNPRPPQRRSSSGGLWFMGVVFILFLFFGFSILFSGTKLILEPKQAMVSVDNTFNATKEAGPNELQYEIMTLRKEGEEVVPADGEEFVREHASGEITVFNNYSTQPLRLVENTRFESEEGMIYRTREAVIVPGKTVEEDGTETPGKVTVRVHADEPGETYNVTQTEFTIPGLKGDPSFEETYARIATPISGGFEGMQLNVAEDTESAIRSDLQNSLKTQLLNEAYSQKPEGFILYDDATFISYESLPNQRAGENVKVREQAVLHGIIFSKEELAEHIASEHISSFKGGDISIQNPESLTFALEEKDSFTPSASEDISFTLQGSAHLVWTYNKDEVRRDFAGKHKDDADQILSQYPSIQKAEVVMRPFWKRTFPEDIQEITVEEKISQE